MIVFHITDRATWDASQASGTYRAPSLDSEGFIHCSTREQIPGTLARFFSGRQDLVLLFVDADRTGAELRWEDGFPHLYGHIPVSAVVDVVDL
jgi:uncharacterized protein (DUF952 family)